MFEKQHESIDDIKRKLKAIEQHHGDKPLDKGAVDVIKDAVKNLHGVVNYHHEMIGGDIKT